MLLHLETGAGGTVPVQLPAAAVINVRAQEPQDERHSDQGDQDREVTITVELTVTEKVTYEFGAEVEVPERVTTDPETLRDYLAENEEIWLDHLNPLTHCESVNERSLDNASVLLAAWPPVTPNRAGVAAAI